MGLPIRVIRTQFDPRRIPGIELWLDASDASTLYDATTGGSLVAADGGVGRWEDKSGKARHPTQSTANNRPQRKVQAIGGLDALLYDGSNDSLVLPSFTLTQPFVVIAVVRHATASGGPHFIYDAPLGANRSFTNHNSSNAGLSSGTQMTTSSNFFAAGVTLVLSAVHDGASSAIRRNAVQQVSGDAGTNGFANGFIGANSSSGLYSWNGHICEFLIFSGNLSAPALQYLERGLMAKWRV